MEQDARRRLEDVLDREIDAARSLAATLASERTALTGDSPEAVEQNAAENDHPLRIQRTASSGDDITGGSDISDRTFIVDDEPAGGDQYKD